MSLYEATASLFYGVRLQRNGRDASKLQPLGNAHYDGFVENRLKELGHELPDWRGLLHSKKPNDKATDAKVTTMLRESNAMIEAATFGCELYQAGSSEQEDTVIYARIKDSRIATSSEDDHGGFGEKIIEPAQLVIGAEWDANLRKFCDLMGFPSELVKPRWTLTMRG